MPKIEDVNLPYSYCGTITFDSAYDLDYKEYLIQRITYMLSDYLRHTQTSMYKIKMVKEYHKVGDQDDPESPHIHFILYSYKKLSIPRVKAIQSVMKETYGRSQFFLMTRLKKIQWEEYIMKDVEKNDEQFGGNHVYETIIGPIQTVKQNKYCLETYDLISE